MVHSKSHHILVLADWLICYVMYIRAEENLLQFVYCEIHCKELDIYEYIIIEMLGTIFRAHFLSGRKKRLNGPCENELDVFHRYRIRFRHLYIFVYELVAVGVFAFVRSPQEKCSFFEYCNRKNTIPVFSATFSVFRVFLLSRRSQCQNNVRSSIAIVFFRYIIILFYEISTVQYQKS